ncbi:MAG: hypothetical protein ACXABD_20800 [Candidatus Thorarchaeota archaeon]|jgi:hypothetical protein
MAEETAEKAKRRTYRDEDWTEEQVKARRAELTVEEAPEGWIKVSEVSNACREEGIPVSKFVRAFGGDRGMNPPVDDLFAFVYVGRTRYVSGKVLTQGLEMLANPEFMKTTRKKKAKDESEEAAPKKSRRKTVVRKK